MGAITGHNANKYSFRLLSAATNGVLMLKHQQSNQFTSYLKYPSEPQTSL